MSAVALRRYLDNIRRQTARQLAYRVWNRTFRTWHLRPPHKPIDPEASAIDPVAFKLPPLPLEDAAAAFQGLIRSGSEANDSAPPDSLEENEQHNAQRFRGFVNRLVVPAVAGDGDARRRMRATLRRWFTRSLGGEAVMMDPLTVALRIREWTWTLLLTSGRGDLPEAYRAAMCWSMRRQARRLSRHVEHETPGNHPLGCLLALWLAELAVGAGPGSRRVKRLGQRFVAESEASFLNDGFHVELSTHYHVQALRFIEEYRMFSAYSGESIPAEQFGIMQRAHDVVTNLMSVASTAPVIGNQSDSFFEDALDDDVATLRFIGDGHGAPPTISAALCRLLGGCHSSAPGEDKQADAQMIVYPDAGYIVAKTAGTPADLTLLVDAGPLGLASNPGHGHADQLSFLLYDRKRPVLVDPGAFAYDNSPLALWFKTGHAHNTMWCQEWDQAQLWRRFRWAALPERPSLRTDTSAQAVTIAAEARYGPPASRIRHRRTFHLKTSCRLPVNLVH